MRSLRHPHRIRIRAQERVLFTKRLSLYLRAGIPILVALDLLLEQAGSSAHQYILSEVKSSVRSGVPLSQALSMFPRAYLPFHIQCIAVGEASGTLPDSLSYLSETLERHLRRSQNIRSALAYPCIILLGTLGISLFLILYVFPKIAPLFRGLHATLPLPTRILITLSEFLTHFWLVVLVGLFFAIFGIHILLRKVRVRKFADQLVLQLPVIGKIVQYYCLASTFRILSVLLGSGLRIDRALELTRKSITHTRFNESLQEIERAVIHGEKMTNAMERYPALYPRTSIQLTATGEMTGTLPESLRMASALNEEVFEERLQRLSVLLEPLLMLCMGLVVGFVALAIISPMYSLTQNLNVH